MRSVTLASALAVSLIGAGALYFFWFQTEESAPQIRPTPVRRPRPELPKPLEKTFIRTDRPKTNKVSIREVKAPATPAIIPGSLIVRVLDSIKSKPIPEAKVWIAGNPNKKTTDDQGRIAFPVKADPKLHIVAFKHGYELVKKPSNELDPRGLGLIIKLKPKATGSIEGEVRFEGSEPENFRILLDSDNYEFPMADGRFRIAPVNVGSHSIGLAVPGKGRGIPLQLQTVTVSEDRPTEVVLTMPHLARVRGTLRNELGQPIGPGLVKLGRVNIAVGNDGRFDCEIILPGAYVPNLFHREYGAISAPSMTLEPGEFRDDLNFTMTPAGYGRVKGRIEAEGVELERLRVVLRSRTATPQRPNNPLTGGKRINYRVVYADASGAFAFAHLGPGKYTLEAVLPSGRSLSEELEIRNDETLDIRLVND